MKRMCTERMSLVRTVGPKRLVVPSHRLRHGMYLETNALTHFFTSHRSMSTQFMNAKPWTYHEKFECFVRADAKLGDFLVGIRVSHLRNRVIMR